MKCNLGNSEGRFWRFGGDKTFEELLFLNKVYLRVYLFESLQFTYELREGKHKRLFSVSMRTYMYTYLVGDGFDIHEERR